MFDNCVIARRHLFILTASFLRRAGYVSNEGCGAKGGAGWEGPGERKGKQKGPVFDTTPEATKNAPLKTQKKKEKVKQDIDDLTEVTDDTDEPAASWRNLVGEEGVRVRDRQVGGEG